MVVDGEYSRRKRKIPAAASLVATFVMALTIVAPVSAEPSPALSTGSGPIPICPDPITEGESGLVGMRWPGASPMRPVYFYTFITGHTADYSDFDGNKRVTAGGDGVTNPVWVPISTTEDSRPEHDETFVMGTVTYSGLFGCVITIVDDDAPAITGTAVTSTPARGDTYRSGENIDVELTFDKPVDVADDASLTLGIGGGGQRTLREASYLRGSGTRRLVFRYRVQPTDYDSDGISVSSTGEEHGPIDGLSGVIYARGTDVPIDPTMAGLETVPDHKVDGRPYVTQVGVISTPPDGWEAYRAGQTIEIALRFDTHVEVEGELRLGLYVGLVHDNWAEAWREADYLRGSGTDTLVFGYTVQAGDTDIRGIAIPYGATAVIGPGTIKAEGTDVEYQQHFGATDHLPDHKIDTAAPRIRGVYMTSRPADREAYREGESISIDVVFNEPVAKTGDLRLELDIGGTTRYASLRPEANPNRRYDNDMTFEYRIQGDDADPDGIEIRADSLDLNGGTIPRPRRQPRRPLPRVGSRQPPPHGRHQPRALAASRCSCKLPLRRPSASTLVFETDDMVVRLLHVAFVSALRASGSHGEETRTGRQLLGTTPWALLERTLRWSMLTSPGRSLAGPRAKCARGSLSTLRAGATDP